MSDRGFQFPCELPIKAMGRADDSFGAHVADIIARHTVVEDTAVRMKSSGAGRFQSITVTVHIETREQMEAIYRDLQASSEVLWTL